MTPKLKVRSTGVLQDLGGDDYVQEVEVVDEDRPWLDIRLGVRESHDEGIVIFRLATVHITSADLAESQPTVVLSDGEWWQAVLDEVLEHVAFTTTRFDHAVERSEPVFTYRYGWDDGYVQESEISPA